MIDMIFLPFQLKGKKESSLFERGNLLKVFNLLKIKQWEPRLSFPLAGLNFLSSINEGRKRDP